MACAASTSFFLIWTTPPPTFLPRYLRTIDSIFRWHPSSRVSVLSNSLPVNFDLFEPFRTAKFDLQVERYSLWELTINTPAQTWLGFREVWNRSQYFANHEADLLRLLTLHHRGGVYVDTDVLFLRPLILEGCCAGIAGLESGSGGVRRLISLAAQHDADHLTSVKQQQQQQAEEVIVAGAAGSEPILCNALMAFAAGSPLLARLIHTFVHEYVPLTPGLSMLELHARGEWGAMGPLLLTRVLLGGGGGGATREGDGVHGSGGACILEREAFYPIAPQHASDSFGPWREQRDAPLLARLRERSVAVHYWNALTRETALVCGSLMHRLFEESCVLCAPALPCVSVG